MAKKLKTCICCIIKDEQLYLKEWIEHHLGLGFDAIYLYEDYGSLSHTDIVSEYKDKVFLHSIDEIKDYLYYEGYKQFDLFNYFIKRYKDKYDWVLFNDIDEYVTFKRSYNLHKLLKCFKDESGIFLYWKNIGNDSQIYANDNKVVERFKKECLILDIDKKSFGFKSFVNLNKDDILLMDLHRVKWGVNTKGERQYVVPMYDKCWLNHYFTKSWEEWCVRFLKRGDLVKGHRKIDDFFECNPDMLPRKQELYDILENEFKAKYKC